MNNIKKARERAGLSQKEVAITLGVAQPTVSNWETGERTPIGKHLFRLSELLSCTTDYLLGKPMPAETKDSVYTKPALTSRFTTEEFLAQRGITGKDRIATLENILDLMAKAEAGSEYAGEFIEKA